MSCQAQNAKGKGKDIYLAHLPVEATHILSATRTTNRIEDYIEGNSVSIHSLLDHGLMHL
jgi:hypothetical protein